MAHCGAARVNWCLGRRRPCRRGVRTCPSTPALFTPARGDPQRRNAATGGGHEDRAPGHRQCTNAVSPRHPSQSALYRCVQQHFESWLAHRSREKYPGGALRSCTCANRSSGSSLLVSEHVARVVPFMPLARAACASRSRPIGLTCSPSDAPAELASREPQTPLNRLNPATARVAPAP